MLEPYAPPPLQQVDRFSGWSVHALYQRRTPIRLTADEYSKLSATRAENWDQERADWHANLPFVRTTQAQAILDAMGALVSSNRQAVDEAKPALLIDGRAGFGKSAVMKEGLYEFHRLHEATRIPEPRSRARAIDVVHISMRSATNERGLAERLRDFLELPPVGKTEREITKRVLDTIFECGVKIIAIDELHFLGQSLAAGRRMSNYIKDLLNGTPCTFIFGGNDVLASPVFSADRGRPDAAGEQFLSLIEPHAMQPFTIATRSDEWVMTLMALEENIRLTRSQRGDLFWTCADVMWAMTGGRWRALSRLLNRVCVKAIETGQERITPGLFSGLPIDLLAGSDASKYLATLGDGSWTSLPKDI